MMHELHYHKDSSFVTLTYDDDHIPDFASLRKSHFQKFMKRLRKRLLERKIRYFACGEYGETTQRPHYHMILFGLSLRDPDKQLVKDSWEYCDWSNRTIERNSFGMVEPESIQYVAGYIDKKFTGELAEREYKDKNREPVFKVSSQGLGRQYCDDYQEEFLDNQFIRYRGNKVSIPRYYLKRLDIKSDFFDTEENNQRKKEKHYQLMSHYAEQEIRTIDDMVLARSSEKIKQREIKSKRQYERNLRSKAQLKQSKL